MSQVCFKCSQHLGAKNRNEFNEQCEQSVLFMTGLGNKFYYKSSQNIVNLFGWLENWRFLNKIYCGYIFGNFWTKLGNFLLQHLVTLAKSKNIPFTYIKLLLISNVLLNLSLS